MRARLGVALPFAALAAGLSVPPASAQAVAEIRQTDSPAAVENSYIVMLRDSGTSPAALAHRHGGAVRAVFSSIPGFSVEMDEDAARRLAADPAVAYVEQDQRVAATSVQVDPPSWGLDRVDERDLPLDGQYSYDTSGAGVSVYVIDTGIYKDHADFGTRARFGRNTVDENDYAADCSGHGTHVAGTIGGTAHGVAKHVSLVGVQVLGCLSGGTVTDVVQGVDWVTANAVRPAVANMSIGGRPSDVLTAAVNASIDAGITYVAAAGNENANACDSAPAGIPRVITVAASTEWDARRFDSNHGSCVDLFAPGDQITSAWISDKTATKTIGGTSMAAPHVAGAAALYLAKAPDAPPAEVAASLVRDATTGRLNDIGSGSPNRLVHRVIGPVVRYLSCESALNTITCESAVAGALVPGVRWKRNGVVVPAWDNDLYVTDPCSTGATVRYDVTVTELYSSSHSVSTHVTCRSGPRP